MVIKAENDLTNAVHTLKLKEKCPTGYTVIVVSMTDMSMRELKNISKHCLFTRILISRKPHDICELMTLLPKDLQPDMSLSEQELLTDYATVTR